MADDQSSKRMKTTSGSSGEEVSSDDVRNEALESEIHALRYENARVCKENARLREQLQQLQGNHEALPVSTLAVHVVDLSRLDTSLITQVASFVGISRELLNLALTCKSFGWQQPLSGLDWSLAEEVARQAVSSGQNDVKDVRILLQHYVRGETTWLSILHESEHPKLKFELMGRGNVHFSGDRTLVCGTSDVIPGAAIANNYIMESGIHFAEFAIDHGYPNIGIVRPMPNLDPDRFANQGFSFFRRAFYDDFLAARTDEWGDDNVHACEYYVGNGGVIWTDWEGGGDDEEIEWVGMEDCKTGDTVGMMLNLNEGTLTVYKNSRRLGVMKDGLSGSYCWYVGVLGGSRVTIIRSGVRIDLNAEVLKVFRDLRSESGINVNDVISRLSQKGFYEEEIRSSIFYFTAAGQIYTTIDEDHYQYAE